MIAVEGYIDVISMSAGGFAHTVAPLGTALTEDQLALLWRMSEEPILCFDGDKAGRRAAYRAVEIALPHVGPGKIAALRIAARGAGSRRPRPGGGCESRRGRAALRPAVVRHALDARDGGERRLDTPSGAPPWSAVSSTRFTPSSDETVRKHYRSEMEARLRALFGTAADLTRRRASPASVEPWTERPLVRQAVLKPRDESSRPRSRRARSCGAAAPPFPRGRR